MRLGWECTKQMHSLVVDSLEEKSGWREHAGRVSLRGRVSAQLSSEGQEAP